MSWPKAVPQAKSTAKARVAITFRSRHQMESVATALSPELSHPAGQKANARLIRRNKMLRIEFEARDSSSLRAIMSSYLRMLTAIINVSSSLLELEKKPTLTLRSRADAP
ncbi:MAG TPA: KEOPS complex subunit Pcc1 [Terriglobales bacterium]|nr:KEOPS complex subunit Pcc1 [Terriglobales bacterium]